MNRRLALGACNFTIPLSLTIALVTLIPWGSTSHSAERGTASEARPD